MLFAHSLCACIESGQIVDWPSARYDAAFLALVDETGALVELYETRHRLEDGVLIPEPDSRAVSLRDGSSIILIGLQRESLTALPSVDPARALEPKLSRIGLSSCPSGRQEPDEVHYPLTLATPQLQELSASNRDFQPRPVDELPAIGELTVTLARVPAKCLPSDLDERHPFAAEMSLGSDIVVDVAALDSDRLVARSLSSSRRSSSMDRSCGPSEL